MRLSRWRRWRIPDALRVVANDRCSRLGFGRLLARLLRLDLFLDPLLLVGALEEDTGLQRLLNQVRVSAFRALLRNRLVVRRKVTFRIVSAAPEDVAPARLALGNIANSALGALHPFNQI